MSPERRCKYRQRERGKEACLEGRPELGEGIQLARHMSRGAIDQVNGQDENKMRSRDLARALLVLCLAGALLAGLGALVPVLARAKARISYQRLRWLAVGAGNSASLSGAGTQGIGNVQSGPYLPSATASAPLIGWQPVEIPKRWTERKIVSKRHRLTWANGKYLYISNITKELSYKDALKTPELGLDGAARKLLGHHAWYVKKGPFGGYKALLERNPPVLIEAPGEQRPGWRRQEFEKVLGQMLFGREASLPDGR